MTSVTGYGKNFGAGGFTEAGRAVVRRLREAGIPYPVAAHDGNETIHEAGP